MFGHLAEALSITEFCLGYDHPETAECYSKLALANQEKGLFEQASIWIRRAFSIFFKAFGGKDEVTLNAYEILKAIESNVDSKLEILPIE